MNTFQYVKIQMLHLTFEFWNLQMFIQINPIYAL